MPTLLLAGVIRGIALPGDIAPQPQRCSVAPWCLPEADSGGAPQSRVRAAAAHAPGRATGAVPSLIGQVLLYCWAGRGWREWTPPVWEPLVQAQGHGGSWGRCVGACLALGAAHPSQCQPGTAVRAGRAIWGGAGGNEVLNGVWGHVTSQGAEPSRLARQPWLLIWERARGQLSLVEAGKSTGMAGASHEWGAR